MLKKAALWHISVSKESGLPYRLETTYDILGLTAYNYSTYSSVFHLLALRSMRELALANNDNTFATELQNNFTFSQKALDNILWNTTAGYYNAYCGIPAFESPAAYVPGAIMTDSLYAQVLSYSLGLDLLLLNPTHALSHLSSELEKNSSPYGLLVMTGRYPYPGPPQDNAIWMLGNPNWATLNLHLSASPTPGDINRFLEVAEVALNRWRSEINDLWNIAGIMGGIGYRADGLPWITSHYGFFMSCWHLVFALSGQQANLVEGVLAFQPKMSAPYVLPFMLPTILGSLDQRVVGGPVTIRLFFGDLDVMKLSVAGRSCPSPVVIHAGETITC